MSADEEVEEGIRSFTRVLDQINHGHAALDLSQELHTVVGRLHNHARQYDAAVKGKMSIKLELEATPHGELRITVQSSSGVTKPKAHGATAWLSPGGNVTFEHPRQQSLALTEVIDQSTGEIKDINDGVAANRRDQ